MTTKVKIGIACEAFDRKTNVVRIKSIQLEGSEEIYAFPDELQLPSEHAELCKNTIISNGIKSVKKRGQVRNLRITLSNELTKIYLDSEKNVCFRDEYLDIVDVHPSNLVPHSERTFEHRRGLHSIVKDMVLEKFCGKKQNAMVWLRLFEKECVRVKILDDQRAEALRLFLEDSAHD